MGTTTTYAAVDTIHTPSTTGEAKPHEIVPWVPHNFWPDPNASEDITILVWAHPDPDDMDEKMDRLFFQNLLMYVSDVAEGKEKLSVLQVMLTQYVRTMFLYFFVSFSPFSFPPLEFFHSPKTCTMKSAWILVQS